MKNRLEEQFLMKKCSAGSLTVGSSLEACDQIRSVLVKGQGIAVRGNLISSSVLQVASFFRTISFEFLFASRKKIVLELSED